MMVLFRDASVYMNGTMEKLDMVFNGSEIAVFGGDVSAFSSIAPALVFDNTVIIPGLCDVHVHLREPGFSYKETIKSGTLASARGGYTAVCSMPNLNPAPDSVENLKIQTDVIDRDACIPVFPYGTITKGQAGLELSDMETMADKVIAFSDDGRGVQSEDMMRSAMLKAKSLGKIIVAHCEDNSLLNGGYIHDGEYARKNGHRGISSESEWVQIERDIRLCKETGCAYHVCHISTKESVDLIRRAKAEGVDITCETAPHYILLDDSCLKEEGRFKMNPPLRSADDRAAILEGIIDGTIDMIATDHAPHSAEEKSRGLEKSAMGIVGIESAFALLYTHLVKKKIISIERLVELMSLNPRKRFGIAFDPKNSVFSREVGFAAFDVSEEYAIDPEEFLSMGRATPFEGESVYGKCIFTAVNKKMVYFNGYKPNKSGESVSHTKADYIYERKNKEHIDW